MVGQTLSHYLVSEKIGEGGMGEVYLAKDTKLDRDVAIKVLPSTFSEDKERLARFKREARLLASLNHPNIAAIHQLEESDGVHFLALEYVPGETLAERLKRGPIQIEEALPLFKQIAEGLEAAHEKGVIHRDLKPANIKVTPEGKVKVLDFGLAKAMAGETPTQQLSESPTITRDATETGVLLGTAPYMSPEQARGKTVDRRADIWAFGCCFYEALTGKAAYLGDTVTDTIAKIVEREPDWPGLPVTTPPSVLTILRRCLKKDPIRRLRDMWDIRVDIEEALAELQTPSLEGTGQQKASARKPVNMSILVVVAAILFALTTTAAVWHYVRTAYSSSPPVTRFVIDLPASEPLEPGLQPAVAVSHNGSRLAYVVRSGAQTRLYIRELKSFTAVPLPGTEGASGPFFSPDGEWVGFFADGTLKRVSVSGGAPFTLCDAGLARGASWGPHGTILFTAAPGTGLWSIPIEGGTPEVRTQLDLTSGERTHRWPQILPDGHLVLFISRTARQSDFDDSRLALVSLETGELTHLVEPGSLARYVLTEHLVFARAGALHVAPFDLSGPRVTGPAVAMVKNVMNNPTTGAAQFSISENGTLVYVAGGEWIPERTLLWVDMKGDETPLAAVRRPFQNPRLSPDGARLTITLERANDDVWLYDFAKQTLSRLTFEAASNVAAIWTPDGKHVTFSSNRDGPYNVYWKPVDGSGPAERLTMSEHIHFPSSWSPNGDILAFTENHPDTGSDLWILPLNGERKPHPFRVTPFNERAATFSPDGRWLAYTSNESGRDEVYVQPFPGGGGQWQVSTEGGTEPVWARNGNELYYRVGARLMAVAVSTKNEFAAARARVLFEGAYEENPIPGFPNYDISPDGRQFVLLQGKVLAAPTQIHVVLNWFEELKRLVPTN